jgi:hypothetical protein
VVLHGDPALATGTAAATGCGKFNAVVAKRVEQRIPADRIEGSTAVDYDLDPLACGQVGPCNQHSHGKQSNDSGENGHRHEQRCHLS